MEQIDEIFNPGARWIREKAAFEPQSSTDHDIAYWTTSEIFHHAQRLAYAIIPINEIAGQIAYDAMLAAHTCRNKPLTHRKSWLANNRYKKYGPTKALRNEIQLVQSFVYREAEKYERYNEGERDLYFSNAGLEQLLKNLILTEADIIVRYIKYLVQLSCDNTANTILAVLKMIFKYRTSDVAEIYTQLLSDGPADNYFSKRRGDLFKRLEDRFSSLIERNIIKVCTGKKREKYFLGQDNFNSHWTTLVDEYLKLFTPWGTNCLQPESPRSFILNWMAKLTETFSEDIRRLNAVHTLLCPRCRNNLITALALPEAHSLLSLPQVSIDNPHNVSGGSEMFSSDIKSEHSVNFDNIDQMLQQSSARRARAIEKGVSRLLIVIDDRVCTTIDTKRNISLPINIAPMAQVMKIYTEDRDGEMLLATLLLDQWLSDRSIMARMLGPKDYQILHGVQNIKLSLQNRENSTEKQILIHCQVQEENRSLLFWQHYSSIMRHVWLK